MSEPVEQSLPSDEKIAVRPEPVEGTDVHASTSSARTDVVEVEHAVDTAHVLRVFEAALLTTQEPLSATQLKRLSEAPLETRQVEELLQKLADKYADSGIELNRVASGWRFRARPELQMHLDKLDPQKPPRYSRAVLETLAIIAYRQPVTRGDIEDIRGVAVSSQVLKTLEARGWIESIGTRDTPGKPALYATTPQFMDDLNLRTLQELPALEEMGTLLEAGIVDGPEQAESKLIEAEAVESNPASSEPESNAA
jgi:segregation and condensation protein B